MHPQHWLSNRVTGRCRVAVQLLLRDVRKRAHQGRQEDPGRNRREHLWLRILLHFGSRWLWQEDQGIQCGGALAFGELRRR
eukprot:s2105_g18.t1